MYRNMMSKLPNPCGYYTTTQYVIKRLSYKYRYRDIVLCRKLKTKKI